MPLADRVGSEHGPGGVYQDDLEPILSVKDFVTKGSMINLDSVLDAEAAGNNMCKQTLT